MSRYDQKRIRLKYRAHVEMGQSPSSSTYSTSTDDGLPFLQGSAEFGKVTPHPKVYSTASVKVAVSGDILLSVRAPVGELNIADRPFGIGRGLCAISPEQDLHRYTWWAIHEAKHQLRSASTGSTYEAVTTQDVENLLVVQNTKDQQRVIADYLDRETARLDALVAAKERLLKLLAEKRRAIITRAVTRGLDPRAPMRDSGIPWLGEIPAHWRSCHLKRVLSAVDYGVSVQVDTSGEIAVLRMGDIQDGEIDYSNVGFVEEVDDALLLRPGDLVFNRTNSLDRIGKVALFRGASAYPVSFASYLVRLRCNGAALPEFLVWLLNSVPVLAWARAEAMPAIGQANLNPHRYGYLPVAIPPPAERTEIVGFLEAKCEKLNILRAESVRTIGLLKERRAALIVAAVTGRIAMPDRNKG